MASLPELKAECAAAFQFLWTVDPFRYGLDTEFAAASKHASHERTETDNVVVRCVLSDRSQGFGEGLPRESKVCTVTRFVPAAEPGTAAV